MPNQILSIKSYSIKTGDIFFFDNNIWMFLLCPIGNYSKDNRQKLYSKFFAYILSRGNHIFTNSLVLSEFSNRVLRLDFDIEKMKPANAGLYSDFKRDYVGSPRFKTMATQTKTLIEQILKISQKCSDEFNSIDLTAILTISLQVGFNDSYYLHLSRQKNWIIVTDDSDLKNKSLPDLGVTILTC